MKEKCWICGSEEPQHELAGAFCKKSKESQDQSDAFGLCFVMVVFIIGIILLAVAK